MQKDNDGFDFNTTVLEKNQDRFPQRGTAKPLDYSRQELLEETEKVRDEAAEQGRRLGEQLAEDVLQLVMGRLVNHSEELMQTHKDFDEEEFSKLPYHEQVRQVYNIDLSSLVLECVYGTLVTRFLNQSVQTAPLVISRLYAIDRSSGSEKANAELDARGLRFLSSVVTGIKEALDDARDTFVFSPLHQRLRQVEKLDEAAESAHAALRKILKKDG